MVKIGIDALGIETEGGARTSILKMIQFVTASRQQWQYIIYLSKYEPLLKAPNIKQIILPFRRGILSRMFMQAFLPLDVFLRGIDLVHFTKSQASLIPFTKKALTIHDLTILIHPEIHSKTSVLYWKYVQPVMARKMDVVFTVSKNAADDIVKIFGVDQEKVTVIYNRSQFENDMVTLETSSQNIKNKYQLPDEYFLYVGVMALKKNIDTIIKAYHVLKSKHLKWPKLVLVGPRYSISDAGNALDLIDVLNLENDILYLGKLPKDHLYYVFKNASIFLFPSYHEGFGIPCLEAMQLGVPLMASKASAIPEVVGDAGVLVEKYMSVETWAEEIKKLYEDPNKRKQLTEKGIKRFEEISRKHSYSAVIDDYEHLLE